MARSHRTILGCPHKPSMINTVAALTSAQLTTHGEVTLEY